MSAWNNMIGVEEVAECRECGCRSTDDVRGLDAFVYVVKGYGCVRMCKQCADLHKFGQTGLMAVLIAEAREKVEQADPELRAKRSLHVQCYPGRAPTTLEKLQHISACAKWSRENARGAQ